MDKRFCAVLWAAFLAPCIAYADPVELRLIDGSFALSGELIGFDGSNYVLNGEFGPVMMSVDTVVCTGLGCPDVEREPTIRIAGPSDFTQDILQDVAFALSGDIQVDPITKPSALALADLLTNQTDMVVSKRYLTESELAVAAQIPSIRLKQVVIGHQSINLSSNDDDLLKVMAPRDLAVALDPAADGFQDTKIVGDQEDIIALRQFLFLSGPHPVAPTSGRIMADAIEPGQFSVSFSGVCGADDRGKFSPPAQRPIVLIYDELRTDENISRLVRFFKSKSGQDILDAAGIIRLWDASIAQGAAQDWQHAVWLNNTEPETLTLSQKAASALVGFERLPIELHLAEDATNLDLVSKSILDAFSDDVRNGAFEDRTLLFIGYSDSSGTSQTNKQVSSTRAGFVRDQLRSIVGRTVMDKISTRSIGLGQAMPRYCNDTNWGRRNNRRVEIWVNRLK